jgi:DNA mismatch endonuclease (patch repair protein)
MNLCVCGCGNPTTKPGNRFLVGHAIRLRTGENAIHFGKIHSEETREKMRLKKLGKKHTAEHNKKISLRMQGENNPFFGRKHTRESIQKRLEKMKDWRPSQEHRASISQKMKGHPVSEESRRRSSENQKGRIFSLETRRKISEAVKIAMRTPETQAKIIARPIQSFKFSDTDIELAIQKILTENRIGFETQAHVFGRPDVFIKPNICIFCDGDYWHRLPRALIRDKEVNECLTQNGFIVLRFWEKEIKKDVNSCFQRIQQAIRSAQERAV